MGEGFRYKQCIVLRADLGMSVGKLISQACHAAVEASEEAKRRRPRVWRRWREEGAKKVVLRVESLEELEELAERAEELDITHVVIRDRGLTEVPPGTITALGLGPDLSERMDRVTGHLKLLR
ncbi:MAG: peptidyl-tRNA hydrolase [Candidatus Bathyarchaeota archaeon B23]|nr:MAG: peptidyl-tRNA hydrolase [Candidatus Bathyarchaeota archaeon B23]